MKPIIFLKPDTQEEDFDFDLAVEGFFICSALDYEVINDQVAQITFFSVMDKLGNVYNVPPHYVKFKQNPLGELKHILALNGVDKTLLNNVFKPFE